MKIIIILYTLLIMFIISCKEPKDTIVPVQPQEEPIIKVVPVDPCKANSSSSTCLPALEVKEMQSQSPARDKKPGLPASLIPPQPIQSEERVQPEKDETPVTEEIPIQPEGEQEEKEELYQEPEVHSEPVEPHEPIPIEEPQPAVHLPESPIVTQPEKRETPKAAETIEIKGQQEEPSSEEPQKDESHETKHSHGVPLTLDASLEERELMVSSWCVDMRKFAHKHFSDGVHIYEKPYKKTSEAARCSQFENKLYSTNIAKFDIYVDDGELFGRVSYWQGDSIISKTIKENGRYAREAIEKYDRYQHGFFLDERLPRMPYLEGFDIIYYIRTRERQLIIGNRREALVAFLGE